MTELADCGLVKSTKAGRVRTYQLTPRTLEKAGKWMMDQRELWERRLDQLENYLQTLKPKEKKS